MKQLLQLTKTFLVMAMLCVGTSAWAETGSATVKMTYVSGTDANVDVSYGDIALNTEVSSGYHSLSNGTVNLGNKGWGVNNLIFLQVDASAIEGTITGATLSATLGSNGSRGLTYGVGYNSSTWSNTMTWNTADRSITACGSTVSVAKNATASTQSFDISSALVGDADKIVTILIYQTAPGGGNFSNPAVTITYTTETVYRINFSESNSVNATVKIDNQDVTDGVSLTDGNYDFTATAEGYQDYSGSFTVNGAAQTVNFTMAKSPRYAFTVNAVSDGNTVKALYTDEDSYDGKVHNVYFPRYLTGEGNVVTHSKNNDTYYAQYTSASDAATQEVAYSAYDGTAWFFEGEDFAWLGTKESSSNYSSGKAGRGSNSTNNIMSFATAGTYSMTYAVCNNNTNYEYVSAFYKNNSENVISQNETTKWSVNYIKTTGTKTVDDITFAENDVLQFYSGSANIILDYVFISLTRPATVSATIASSGYTSLSSAYALDFSGFGDELTAFVVTKATSDGVTLSSVTEAPAETGLILKGTAGETYNIPVVAEATAPTTNLLEAAVTATPVEDGSAYILKGGVFCLLEGAADEAARTIPAGKAYLPKSNVTTGKANLTFAMGEDVTGVANVTANDNRSVNGYFDLQGRRVSQPTKGLYIMNGKKYVVK